MSDPEKQFLVEMARIARLQEAWLSRSDLTHPSSFERALCVLLNLAGMKLLLRPRFHVICTIDESERAVEIVPRNGQAERMMTRYKELLLEYELSQG